MTPKLNLKELLFTTDKRIKNKQTNGQKYRVKTTKFRT